MLMQLKNKGNANRESTTRHLLNVDGEERKESNYKPQGIEYENDVPQ